MANGGRNWWEEFPYKRRGRKPVPAGDAGLERQTADAEYQTICGWVTKYGWLNTAMAERVRQLLHRQQAVIDAARQRVASADAAWLELGVSTEDTPELAIQLDPNGHWAALRAALIALDAVQAAQPEGEQSH